MKTIWKFPLEITGEQAVNMPEGANLLTVAMQGPTLCLWAMVDTSRPMRPLRVLVFGTGHQIDEGDIGYVGTAHDTARGPPGGLVWHVFAEPWPMEVA